MNHQEAAAVLAQFAAAYGREVDHGQAEVWWNACLSTCPAPVAERVVARIVAQDERFPSPARFSEIRRAIERGLEPAHKELPAGPLPSKDRVQEIIGEIRAKLRGAA